MVFWEIKLAEILDASESDTKTNSSGKKGSATTRHLELTEAQLLDLEKEEKNTQKTTAWATGILFDWLKQKSFNIAFRVIPLPVLNNLLRKFYATVRSSEGRGYSVSCYVSLS